MKRKKICIITGAHWSAVMGGAQYQVKCILDDLLKNQQLEVIYLAREINPNYKPDNYHIRQIAKLNRVRRISFLFDHRKLTKKLEAIGPDVIYQRGLAAHTGVAARYSMLNNCEFIFHVAHDFDVQPNKYLNKSRYPFIIKAEKKLGVYGLKRAAKIITQTRHQYDLLKHNYGIVADMVVPNFHPYPTEEINKDETLIKIVWVANFKPFKQPEQFVRLAQDMKNHSNIKFIMIGRPGSPAKFNDLHKIIQNIDNLEYVGEKTIEEVNEILATSHIFVNTSKAEGFANTFIQAWMRKVPVVSLHVNTDDNFNNQKIGIFGGSYEGLKSGVTKLVKDKKLRVRMGDNAQEYAFKHHTMSNAKHITSIILDNTI